VTSANPRRAAFEILLRVERDHAFAEPLIDRELSRGMLQGPDRGLLTELVYGILRRQGTLDHLVGQFSATRLDKLERSVRLLLRLGLYQLLFLDRIPARAAVNETVELAKVLAPRAAGLVNAVLRRADRERDALRYPDRDRDPVAYLAAAYSHPCWIVAGWLRHLGVSEAEALAAAMANAAPLTIRANTLRTSREALLARWTDAGIDAIPTIHAPDGIRLRSRLPVRELPGFTEGLFAVQDESSQLAAFFLSPRPGERILDACAAPGGKTTYLAQLMENRGEIVAGDRSTEKLRLVADMAAHLGIGIIRTARHDAAHLALAPNEPPFDRILVDAPCSGLGVIRRNPEGKWWRQPDDIARLAEAQRAILANLAGLVRPGGTLLYATCSTTVDENEAVIDDFLSRHGEFVLEDLNALFPAHAPLFTDRGLFRSWPHRDGMDGFFAARLKHQHSGG
jgi:16S rRNA (cytosine967-C5)-methyltransferase